MISIIVTVHTVYCTVYTAYIYVSRIQLRNAAKFNLNCHCVLGSNQTLFKNILWIILMFIRLRWRLHLRVGDGLNPGGAQSPRLGLSGGHPLQYPNSVGNVGLHPVGGDCAAVSNLDGLETIVVRGLVY